ncbi:hypothetical protein B0T18DRAFT_406954 [Schizothecium vesticola]|uniref:Uncharacterized protein n=1 Tax=Schizothecium vesticola TaxID=314040 RepID=A0AA40F204_9PEZI|nr:hypothetical protein B0T18DRAFT_406954 [Schizothecium vesticola]
MLSIYLRKCKSDPAFWGYVDQLGGPTTDEQSRSLFPPPLTQPPASSHHSISTHQNPLTLHRPSTRKSKETSSGVASIIDI